MARYRKQATDIRKINLKAFDMSKIKRDKVCVTIGMRGSGKSFLARDLLYHHRRIPVGIVISGSEKADPFYGDMIPDLYIYDKYKPAVLEALFERQTKAKKEHWAELDTFIILDDCGFDRNVGKDEKIRELFMNGRHYNIMLFIVLQYAMGLPPDLRTNIDYVFLFRDNTHSNKRKLYEYYAGIFPSYEMFNAVYEACTEDYGCMVIDKQSKSTNIEDVVYWYKAQPHPPFRVGSTNYWKTQLNAERKIQELERNKKKTEWLNRSKQHYERKYIVNKAPQI